MPKSASSITFVIGAGASGEVRMPTGHSLKQAIASALSFKVDHFGRLEGGSPTIRETMYQLAQRPGASGNINAYVKSALLIQGAMSLAPSIDNFIDAHRTDVRITECGKLAIAAEILSAERASKLYVDPSNSYNKLKFEDVEDTWFNAFFQLLTLNTPLENLAERLGSVKVVSFNYDRTLEHFLHQAIQNYYGCSSDKAAEVLRSLVILHPYGTVGALPWQQAAAIAVPYGAQPASNTLLSVASALRTFTEGTSYAESQIEEIRSCVREADTLVFLGFAYHELNLQVLFGPLIEGPKQYSKQVYGTAKGLSESTKKAVAFELTQLGKCDAAQVTLRKELSAAELFPEYSRSLKF